MCSTFLLLLLTNCSSVGNLFYTKVYSTKIYDKINLDRNLGQIKKIYIRESNIGYEKFYSKLKSEIELVEGLKVTDKEEDADFILKINLMYDSNLHITTTKALRNYLAIESTINNFYIDTGNSPRVNNMSAPKIDSKEYTDSEQTVTRSNKKIGTATAFGAGVGYLVGGGLTSTLIGAATAFPVMILADEASRGTGYILSFEIELQQNLKKKVDINIKILSKNSGNETAELSYIDKTDKISKTAKILVLGTGSVYSAEDIRNGCFNVFIDKINQIF